jgi:hypothetical protein
MDIIIGIGNNWIEERVERLQPVEVEERNRYICSLLQLNKATDDYEK